MATTLSTAARNAACDATVDLVDAGGGAGKFRIKDTGGTVIAEVTCAATAFGAASNGVATLDGPIAGAGLAAAGAGTDATSFDLCDSTNAVIISGAVGVGTGELQLDNVSIAEDQVVSVSSFTHTQS
jgi:hypothetical protein